MRPLVRQLIAGARRRIESPQCWTQHAIARDDTGRRIGFGQSLLPAACWCAFGALAAEYQMAFKNRELPQVEVDEISDALLTAENLLGTAAVSRGHGDELLGVDALTGFNDASSTTHADVLALFDTVLDRPESRSGGTGRA